MMTAKQAAAAKAKGWLPLACTGLDDEGIGIWEEYKGGDGIEKIKNEKLKIKNEADVWYDLDGRKLGGKPTQRGLYIHNGKQVIY